MHVRRTVVIFGSGANLRSRSEDRSAVPCLQRRPLTCFSVECGAKLLRLLTLARATPSVETVAAEAVGHTRCRLDLINYAKPLDALVCVAASLADAKTPLNIRRVVSTLPTTAS